MMGFNSRNARWIAGIAFFLLATFPSSAAYNDLKVTEIMYHPADDTNAVYLDPDFEFLEIKNTGASALNMSGVRITKGVNFSFGALSLDTGETVVVVNNFAAFASRYATNGILFGGSWTNGDKLNNSGELIEVKDPANNLVISFAYTNVWYSATDGLGFSLVAVSSFPAGDPGLQDYWRVSSEIHGSPGRDDLAPSGADILITEALTHTDWPQVDAVELFNPSNAPMDIGGWWLTDDAADPQKYRMPDATIIGSNSYLVILGDNDGDPSNNVALPSQYFGGEFLLSEYGEQLYLFSPDLSYSNGFTFGASQNGVSFGRYAASDGRIYYPPQITNSLGWTNAGPAIGPFVVTEVMYAPMTDDYQFIELMNASNGVAALYSTERPDKTWTIPAVGFVFPTNIEVGASQRIVLVRDNIGTNEFKSKKRMPPETPVFNYSGALSATNRCIQLFRPDRPDGDLTPYVLADEVNIDIVSPWPTNANGTGRSIKRRSVQTFGSEPTNWHATVFGGAPGAAAPADGDNDGLPDDWETSAGLSPSDPGDAGVDTDVDSVANSMEYLHHSSPTNADSDADSLKDGDEITAGTDPADSESVFRIVSVQGSPSQDFGVVSWLSVTGRLYSIAVSSNLAAPTGGFAAVTNGIRAPAGIISCTDAVARPRPVFYQLKVKRE